ncbi:MAG TPA: DUF1232 domain-containing protein [Chitinophagales bacterium]|jgi:uncharacterized membrane protein YkvA (DUF1232 family)|nr:DUF1232 domain-containing protein [Chitinophagales bacterium]HQW79173.1 DUF1232 domain-containing protein [Chitinophagales bacterium]HRB67336.1 DUF1232 domain-containing protein [Chitinophagales bacterium]HRB67343.1 DUF1232 domain-containing protein [Chitinophagales bacterium]HRB69196.1 DUF1232 domain-containing protein [Chitinophagales bacterium]
MTKPSFLDFLVGKYYPVTSIKVQELMTSNVLLENLLKRVYASLDSTVQKYADNFERIKVVLRLVEAWRNKQYLEVSKSALFVGILILLYIVSPLDILPDFIPIVGGLDDILLIGYLLTIIDKEIERFLNWEQRFATNR